MRRVLPVAAVCLVLCAALTIGAGGATASAPAQSSPQWNACGGGFQCSTLPVPLDYSNPSGPKVNLALIRLPASNPSERIGSLLVNPGGPGASAIDFLRIWAQIVAPEIRSHFDLVAFDPRGVGYSQGIECHNTLQQLVAVTPNPQDTAQWTQAEQVSKAFVDACGKKYGNFLNYMGTKNVARDMDSVRKALGDNKLTYLGYSYGTAIGQVYAEMYPGTIRAMVLDGAMNLGLNFEQVNETQAEGFQRVYDAYLQNCRAQSCPLTQYGNPATVVNNLMKQVEKKPLAAPGEDRVAGPGELETAVVSALYSQQSWPDLTNALVAALNGNGAGLIQLTDQYLERNPDGSYPDLIEANMAVNYVDQTCPKDVNTYMQLAQQWAKVAPFFGPGQAVSGLTCAYWPAKPDPVAAPTPAETQATPPIVVIDTTNDPATPYEWGIAVTKQLAHAVLIIHRGNGHTIYAQGNSCVDGAVNNYLINLQPPANDTTCGNGPPPPVNAQGTPVNSPTLSPSATATPATTPSTPTAPAQSPTVVPAANTADRSSDSGGATGIILVVAFVVIAIAAAGGVVYWQRRRL